MTLHVTILRTNFDVKQCVDCTSAFLRKDSCKIYEENYLHVCLYL